MRRQRANAGDNRLRLSFGAPDAEACGELLDQPANDALLAIATIEHPEAIRNIDEIVATPGLDLAIIGPGDLAMAMGIPGQFEHPDFVGAVQEAERGILRSKVALGGVAMTPEQAKRMVDRGYRVIGFGFDWMLLQQSAGRFIEEVRR